MATQELVVVFNGAFRKEMTPSDARCVEKQPTGTFVPEHLQPPPTDR